MCFSKPKPTPAPAAAPAAPLPPADEPEIGGTRRQESRDVYGADTPSYRVNRDAPRNMNPDGQVRM
jgi:hypothetical protein